MELIPAIDLLAGQAVRLLKGDYDAVTDYGDPVAIARAWAGQARRLHVVDLEGARAGRPVQLPLVTELSRAFGPGVQVGGGLRGEESMAQLVAAGVERLVLGTAAVRDPELVARVARRWPGRVVIAVDARDGKVATDGWLQQSDVTASSLVRSFAHLPLAAVLYTDIDRDGTEVGPNVPATLRLAEAGVPVIASGGVGTLDHLRALAASGNVAGAIVGRALHEGRFTLGAALEAARGA